MTGPGRRVTAGEDAWTRFAVPVVGVARGAVVGVAAQVLAALGVVALALVPLLGLGVPIAVELTDLTRRLAAEQRRWAGGVLGVTLADPHPPWPAGPVWRRARVLAGEPATRRDLAWLWWQALTAPLCLVGVAVPVLVGYAVLVGGSGGVGWMSVVLTPIALVAAGTGVLLAVPFHRAQAVVARRLVGLGLAVGLARTEVRNSPERADELLAEVGRDVGATLEELRALVRGIHPPVLAERGLPSALEALALAASVPVSTRIDLDARFDAPVESAVWFAVAEVLTNVSRHAGATRAELTARHDGERLRLHVADDGHGGADPAGGSGLAGVADRLAALDGTMTLASPAGGPTTIELEVPCAPSSPRTRPCSATASPGSSPPTASP